MNIMFIYETAYNNNNIQVDYNVVRRTTVSSLCVYFGIER